MDVAPTIARLREQCPPPLFRSIGGAIELDAAVQSVPATPCAFVMPLAERAAEPHLASHTDQIVTQDISIVICLTNRRDAVGAAAVQDLKALRLAVRSALLGWAPDECDGNALEFVSGRLLRFNDGRLWWADEFRVITTIY
jgi:hypothetical protein